MHRILLFAAATLITCYIQAQIAHDLTIYSEDGLKFTLTVNGETVNAEPSTNVKLENTNYDFARVVITFEDENIPQIERKALQLATPGTGPKGPVAVVFAIKEKKGEQILRFVGRSAKKIQDNPTININNK